MFCAADSLGVFSNRHYATALSHKPDFDIALANMGNAVKDTVR